MTKEKAVEVLRQNPQIYEDFERESMLIVNRGFKHYSARTIVHYLRHWTALHADPDSEFKINNDLSPFLARMFMCRNRDRIPKKFFEYRVSMADEVEYGTETRAA